MMGSYSHVRSFYFQCTHHTTHIHTHPQPTIEQFISMNRDINNGHELPSEMLRVRQLVLSSQQ